jgi:hypothetical protein
MVGDAELGACGRVASRPPGTIITCSLFWLADFMRRPCRKGKAAPAFRFLLEDVGMSSRSEEQWSRKSDAAADRWRSRWKTMGFAQIADDAAECLLSLFVNPGHNRVPQTVVYGRDNA